MIMSRKKITVNNSQAVAKVLQAILEAEDEISQEREHFWVVGLNAKNVIQYVELAHLGHLTGCPAMPREIFRHAVAQGVAAIVLAHNHPSGDPTPSPEDIAITRKIIAGGQLLGIEVHDHIILGEGETFFSLCDTGRLRQIKQEVQS